MPSEYVTVDLPAFSNGELSEIMQAHGRLGLTCHGNERPEVWHIVEVEGAGQGCVALEYIPRGTLLLLEAPVFVIDEVEDGPKSQATITEIKRAVRALPTRRRQAFKALTEPGNRKTDVGRFETNNICVCEGQGHRYRWVCVKDKVVSIDVCMISMWWCKLDSRDWVGDGL